MSRKLLQQSLDALNLIFRSTPPYKENGECTLTDSASKLCCETIDALEAELSKPEKVKVYAYEDKGSKIKISPVRKWVGLTDDEVDIIVDANTTIDDAAYDIWCDGESVARETEAKLKEKNHE
jgi:hypothetical protein